MIKKQNTIHSTSTGLSNTWFIQDYRSLKSDDDMAASLRDPGFIIVDHPINLKTSKMHADWKLYVDSWNNLGKDTHALAMGLHRNRRWAKFAVTRSDGAVTLLPHQPYKQSGKFNKFAPDVEREVLPIEPEILANPIFRHTLASIMAPAFKLFPDYSALAFHAHQFEVISEDGTPASPTPEGAHQDGGLMFGRQFIGGSFTGGACQIYEALLDTDGMPYKGSLIYQKQLNIPGQVLYVNDRKLFHGATSIVPIRGHSEGQRRIFVGGVHELTNDDLVALENLTKSLS